MWFLTDNPWPAIAACVIAALLLVFKWSTTHRGSFLIGASVLLVLSVGIYFVERSIITEAERVEQSVHDLAAAVVAGDSDRVLSFFSPREERIRARIAAAMVLYIVQDDMRITDLSVEMRANDSIAVSHFRANGTVVGAATQMGGRGATRWELTWRREADDWKIIEVVRLHPIRDETMEILDAIE